MIITCPILDEDNFLPEKYTCKGKGLSPPLEIKEVPKNAESLLLVMFDPDAPLKTFIHWILYDIPSNIATIRENESRFKKGRNSLFMKGYFPPCPLWKRHRYVFEIHAIDKFLGMGDGASIRRIKKEIEGHVVDKARLVTVFGRR